MKFIWEIFAFVICGVDSSEVDVLYTFQGNFNRVCLKFNLSNSSATFSRMIRPLLIRSSSKLPVCKRQNFTLVTDDRRWGSAVLPEHEHQLLGNCPVVVHADALWSATTRQSLPMHEPIATQPPTRPRPRSYVGIGIESCRD